MAVRQQANTEGCARLTMAGVAVQLSKTFNLQTSLVSLICRHVSLGAG
jgi:hypothetical protein